MLNFLVIAALFYFATRRSAFWPWIATRSFGQLFGITMFLSVCVWGVVQCTGYGV